MQTISTILIQIECNNCKRPHPLSCQRLLPICVDTTTTTNNNNNTNDLVPLTKEEAKIMKMYHHHRWKPMLPTAAVIPVMVRVALRLVVFWPVDWMQE